MNQAASATRGPPAGSASTASCCPMFNSPFFVNTFAPQTPLLPPPAVQPCFLGTQSSQHAQISSSSSAALGTTTNINNSTNTTNQRSQQQNIVLPNQQSVSQLSTNSQPQQPVSQQPQEHSNNYNTSISPPNLSLQQLFTGRPSPTSCMALAAALAASATFPHFHHQPPPQQQQQSIQNHQTPINQTTTNTTTNITVTNNVNPVITPTNSATTTTTNQVPILNFNSYSSAPPFLNLSAPAVPPAAAHLNSSTSIHHNQQQQQQQQQQHQQQQQQQQPQSTLPPIPFYSYPQMEQALALLTNPQVANNIFSHVFNIYLQSGLRSDPNHTHHHHHPPHHFHHHSHGAQHHHHHHHGPNSQGNGQDATMPLDSLAINETKPRGLNRAEIDSLTPYIHMNEKDSKTCVICLSKFELKSKIRPLPCNHSFHAKCVDKWLRANRSCPICRRDALRTYNPKIKRI